jgi:signal transduction histidine kinase
MSERATMADGWCQVDSHPGQGTTVRFWLPTKDTG